MRKAIFFDRDGTLNQRANGYVWRWDQFKWRTGAVSAVKAVNQAGYLAIVVTNQAGIAYGHYAERDVELLHQLMGNDLARHAAHVDGYFFCPHHPNGKLPRYAVACHCRKPEPGLLETAIDAFDVDPRESYMIGDQVTDMQAAQAAGVNGVILRHNEDVGTVVRYLLQKVQITV